MRPTSPLIEHPSARRRLASLVSLLSLLVALVVIPAPPASAATFVVDTTGDDAADDCLGGNPCSLRGAIGSAAAGDTVTVPAGTFVVAEPPGTIEVSEGVAIVGAGSTLDPTVSTVITGDASLAGRLLSADVGGHLELRDLALSSHTATVDATVDGVALNVTRASSVTLDNVTVDDMTGSQGFGAVHITGTDTVTITDSTFTDNTVSSGWAGAGVAMIDVGENSSGAVAVTIVGNTFARNTAGDGAGFFLRDLGDGSEGEITARFDDNTFVGNDASKNGGGIRLDRIDGGNADIDVSFAGNTFVGNSAGRDGGGAFLEDIPDLRMDTSVFDGNMAGRRGGAITTDGLFSSVTATDAAAFTIDRSSFAANSSGDELGASGTIVSNASGLTVVTNSTFRNNTSPVGSASVLGEFRSGTFDLDYVTMVGQDVPFDEGAGTSDDAGVVVTASNSAFDDVTSCGVLDGANNVAGSGTDCTGAVDAAGDLELTVDASGEYLTPAATSPLVGAGTDCGEVDQLGTARAATGCTVGAVESTGDPAPVGPTAVLAVDCDDLVCAFDGTNSTDGDDTIVAYDWDLGDGTTNAESALEHSYEQAGDYTVTLTVTDDGEQTDTATDTVTVTAAVQDPVDPGPVDPDPVDPDPVDPDPVDPDPVDSDPGPVSVLECDTAVDPEFDDVTTGSTHVDTIACADGAELFTGYADGTFKPGQAISRAQFASVMFRALNFAGAGLDGLAPEFDDVTAGSTHADAIGALADAGVINGFDDGAFGPGQPITRGQVTAMITSAAVLLGEPFDPADPTFDDVTLGSTHADAIGALAGAGVINGFDDGTFRPGDDVTRGQTATMVVGWLSGLTA